MSITQVVILALIQGIAEFLPISSSGHLVIIQSLMHITNTAVFDIMLHLGSLIAIVVYFRRPLLDIIQGLLTLNPKALKTVKLILIGTVPAIIVGAFLQKRLELLFSTPRLVGFSLLITAVFLFSTRFTKIGTKQLKDLKFKDALLVGIFQAIAILPGISRSGSTLTTGLWRQATPQSTFEFSFLLAIPAIAGAALLQVPHLLKEPALYLQQAFVGLLISAVVSYLALTILSTVLKHSKLWLFGFYCLLLGLITILF